MKRCILALAFASAVFLARPHPATALTHVARAGETLKLLATRYYGEERFSMVIRAANGFMHPDDGRLMQGERVEIPEIVYHRLEADQSWEDLADQYLGTPKRAKYLAELNDAKLDHAPVQGKIILIPYQLLYVLAPDETLRRVSKTYLRGKFSAKWLRAYNLKKKKKYRRGDALLIPLIDVELVEAELAAKEKQKEKGPAEAYSAEDQKTQSIAVAQITNLREAFDKGNYIQILATGQRLLGTGRMTTPQQIGVYKYLAFAYVAFGETRKAQEAFRKALELQPGMELSPITTSPKILDVFRRASEARPSADAGN